MRSCIRRLLPACLAAFLLLQAPGCARPIAPAAWEPATSTAAPAPLDPAIAARSDRYEARIRRTAHGVAHIEAADLGSLGFGEGYAQAEDHVCTIADQVVLARGERARFFGRGEGDAYLRSDVVMRGLRVAERAAEMLEREPQEVRDWLAGVAAGYNRYLAATPSASLPEWCRGQEWVRPISANDVAAIFRLNVLTVPGLVTPLLSAQPPAAATPESDSGREASAVMDSALFALAFPPAPTASNGWALGRDLTEGGRGMLLANPHYPSTGANRFWEKHLRIPGELDVYGVNLIGGPGVLLGFNEHVAWTHTISAGSRFTFFVLDLVPGSPTRYRHGHGEREMTSVEVAIPVRGEREPYRHTIWFSHHGPLLSLNVLQWTTGRAYAVRDANEENGAMPRHLLATARARSLDALRQAYAEHQALPRVNTTAVSAGGIAWYADPSATPNVSEAALADWRRRVESDLVTRQLWQNRVMLLNGSDPASDWVNDPAAAQPGIVPFTRLPQLERTDYIFNANDSYWVPHHEVRLEGDYSPLHGGQQAPLSMRSRNNLLYLTNQSPDRPAGESGRYSLDELQRAIFSNRSLTADLLLPELVQRCRAEPRVTVGDRAVELARACDVLAAWNRRFDLDSRGAVLFREWISRYPVADLTRRGTLWAVDFDPAQALTTPRGLAEGPLALENLARAVMLLERRELALDVPLGELQYAPAKMPRRMPLHGGDGTREGVKNLMVSDFSRTTLEPVAMPSRVEGSLWLTDAGYPVFHGTSFIMALEYTGDGPRARALLSYGQSGDPASPHFTDQTEMFARKEWRPILFREAEIGAGVRREYVVSGERR